MAYLMGLKPSPPEQWHLAGLAKSINKTPPQLTAEDWQWLAITQEMEWLVKAQNLLTSGHGHGLGADTLLLLKRLREEAKKQWPIN